MTADAPTDAIEHATTDATERRTITWVGYLFRLRSTGQTTSSGILTSLPAQPHVSQACRLRELLSKRGSQGLLHRIWHLVLFSFRSLSRILWSARKIFRMTSTSSRFAYSPRRRQTQQRLFLKKREVLF